MRNDSARPDDGCGDLTQAARSNLGKDKYQLENGLAAGKQLVMSYEDAKYLPNSMPEVVASFTAR
jgi:hypothetical protein